jgi:hypothetical protein
MLRAYDRALQVKILSKQQHNDRARGRAIKSTWRERRPLAAGSQETYRSVIEPVCHFRYSRPYNTVASLADSVRWLGSVLE